MGLGWWFYLSGFIWAVASIGVVTAVYVVVSLFKKTRQAFKDDSIGSLSAGKLAFQALVEVPFGTVLLEEIAFRAVLFSMLARRFGVVWAIVISSLMFGIWHVLPASGHTNAIPPWFGRREGLAGQHPDRRGQRACDGCGGCAFCIDAHRVRQRHRPHGAALGNQRSGLWIQLGHPSRSRETPFPVVWDRTVEMRTPAWG